MTPQPEKSYMLRWALAFLIGLFLVVSTLSVRSIVRTLRAPAPEKSESEISPLPSHPPTKQIEVPPRQVTVPPPVQTFPAKSKEVHDFVTDYEKIRQREIIQEKQIENLKKYSTENPDADDALSEEEIKKLQKAGVIVM